MADIKTGKCEFCGKEVAISGLKNHEKACAKKHKGTKKETEIGNKEVAEEVITSENIEVEEEPVEVEVITKQQPRVKLVDIKISESICCYIAGTRYNFIKGEVYTVPENVKNVLMEAGFLLAM